MHLWGSIHGHRDRCAAVEINAHQCAARETDARPGRSLLLHSVHSLSCRGLLLRAAAWHTMQWLGVVSCGVAWLGDGVPQLVVPWLVVACRILAYDAVAWCCVMWLGLVWQWCSAACRVVACRRVPQLGIRCSGLVSYGVAVAFRSLSCRGLSSCATAWHTM